MKITLNLFSLLPSILGAIFAAESAINTQGSGATKKELVLAAIQAAAQVGEQVDQKTIAAVSALIDNLVTVLNKSAILKKAA